MSNHFLVSSYHHRQIYIHLLFILGPINQQIEHIHMYNTHTHIGYLTERERQKKRDKLLNGNNNKVKVKKKKCSRYDQRSEKKWFFFSVKKKIIDPKSSNIE